MRAVMHLSSGAKAFHRQTKSSVYAAITTGCFIASRVALVVQESKGQEDAARGAAQAAAEEAAELRRMLRSAACRQRVRLLIVHLLK